MKSSTLGRRGREDKDLKDLKDPKDCKDEHGLLKMGEPLLSFRSFWSFRSFGRQGIPHLKLFVRHSPPEMPQLKQGTPRNLPAAFSEASFERGQGQEMAPLLQTTPESPPKTPQNGETLPSLAAILQHKNAAIPQGFLLSPH